MTGPPVTRSPGTSQTRKVRQMTSVFDDLPIEVRRHNWGWFGEAWPSGVCYDDDGRLIEEMRKPFPAGERCLWCTEVFDEVAGDAGQALPGPDGGQVRHVHKECMLRQVAGSLAHMEGRCSCYVGGGCSDSGMSARREALAVWNLIHRESEGLGWG